MTLACSSQKVVPCDIFDLPILQSMSRTGDCYDDAFMESSFGTIKTELEMTTYESFEKALKEN